MIKKPSSVRNLDVLKVKIEDEQLLFPSFSVAF